MSDQQILGHEFSGIVVEVGSDVVKYRPGERVAIQPKVLLQLIITRFGAWVI